MESTKIHFGKHKGMDLEDVPASYLLWLYENEIVKDGVVFDYIIKNLDGIKKQIEDGNGGI